MNRPTDASVEFIAIINSFNRKELLQRAITSLTAALRGAEIPSAIVVFEAGSSDGSAEFLEHWRAQNPHDHLLIVRSTTTDRTSFSDGVNQACAAALTNFPQYRWLFLYETDNWIASSKPLDQAIALLHAQPRLAAVGFTVRRHDGTFCGYGMRFPDYFSFALGLNLTLLWHLDAPNDSPWQTTDNIRWRTCDVVFTSPLLIRREGWEQTNGFDAERFPFSESDVDWAWRCAENGWSSAVIASDEVVHDNLQQASDWSATRVVQFHRSRLRVLRRHRGEFVGLLKPLLFLRHALETLLLFLSGRADPKARAKLQNRKQLLRTVWNDYA